MFVFSNLATSMDGKIATADRAHFPLGTTEDRKVMISLRKRADVVLFGASTLRTYKKSCGVPGAKKQPMNAILSSKLDGISPSWPFFKTPDMKRILFVDEGLSTKITRPFEKSCTLIRLKRGKSQAHQMIAALSKMGVKRLLVEGGGGVMWQFVAENLIDEYHLTLTPRILGGSDAPTLVDGEGLSAHQILNLKLRSLKRVGDELFLIYKKTDRRG